MAVGTPVIAYRDGGYKETVIEGETGIFIDDLTVKTVTAAMSKIQNSLRSSGQAKFSINTLRKQAETFSKERFIKKMKYLVEREYQQRVMS